MQTKDRAQNRVAECPWILLRLHGAWNCGILCWEWGHLNLRICHCGFWFPACRITQETISYVPRLRGQVPLLLPSTSQLTFPTAQNSQPVCTSVISQSQDCLKRQSTNPWYHTPVFWRWEYAEVSTLGAVGIIVSFSRWFLASVHLNFSGKCTTLLFLFF